MKKTLLFFVAIFATTFAIGQTITLDSAPSSVSQNATASITVSFDAGASTVETKLGIKIYDVVNAVNVYNQGFNDTVGEVSGTRTANIPIPLNQLLTADGGQYEIQASFKPAGSGWLSITPVAITIEEGYLIDFQDSSTYTLAANNTVTPVTVEWVQDFANPDVTGINANTQCLKITELPAALKWHGTRVSGWGNSKLEDEGQYFTLKFMSLSPGKTDGTVRLIIRISGNNQTLDVPYSGVTVGEWNLIEFYTTETTGYFTSVDVVFDGDGTNTQDNEFLIDDITQKPASVLGVEKIDFKDDVSISLYPNPSQNTISISSKKNVKIAKVEVYNILGQQVLNSEYNGNIDISKLSKGSYIAKIFQDTNVVSTKRFVKQ
ncbi:Por secretion system C-terminal sorting domain-containing protein [Lutibacter oricola]|uniref:Por secretion system C-terminal sorting domain-containing protein n=1 Tax=Lutibacter oricola TaxID=762486 RepID=A0A1H2S9E6_9FLAO|nr:T9SS type A sorting domain-containing protein [Lutibacter oricola]SDW28078.1 Por secretion system C-terminal sorting domain-containing protein [Lutibacter oricola]